LAKSGGLADILHNLHYNDSFLSSKNNNSKNCAKRTYNANYVNIALGKFLCFGFSVGVALCIFVDNRLLNIKFYCKKAMCYKCVGA
jgi:hypothetical protein